VAERVEPPALGPAGDGGASAAREGAESVDRDRSPRRRNRRLAASAVLVVAAAIVAIVLLGSRSQPQHRIGGGLAPGQTTSVVSRRTLTESSTVEGTLGYGAKLELYNRLAGTFTWLPAVGAVIGRGGTLWRVDNRPVALMYGSVPAYRALKEGVSDGPDVAQLNRNLIDLGFDPYGAIDDNQHFGEATAVAVRRWQESEGLPETGKVELGRIVFAPGARRVTAVHVSVGQDPPATGEEPAAKHPREEKEEAEAEEEREEAEEAEEHSNDGSGSKEPGGEESTKEEPADEKPSEEKEGNGSGPGSAAAEAVLDATSIQQLVQLKVSASEQSLAQRGESAPVTLPDGSVVKGRITDVGTVAEAAEGGGGPEGGGEEGSGEATISVTLALERPVARLDQAPVSVELVKQVRHHVLTVPATALFATAGGSYAVQALEGTRRVELAVTPGMFADGYVQVEGHGVQPGLRVTEPSE
jgi:peptidoglycan hydrolase-like protein with peptidoglycan-binding domain